MLGQNAIHYSDALSQVGDSHRYQNLVLIGSCMIWLCIGFQLGSQSFIYQTPSFTCQSAYGPQNEEYACSRLNECHYNDVNSLTYQAGLYCDQAFKRDSIVATNVIGSFVGLLVMGIVGDRYGRFISMTVSLIVIILSALCTVVGGTHKLVPLLMAGQILMGFGIDSAEVTTYFFVIESSSKDFASRSIVKMNSIWAIALMLLCPILYLVPDWRTFTLIFQVGFGSIVLVGYWFLFQETPQYALTRSSENCMILLNKISKVNNHPQIESSLQIIPDNQDEEKTSAEVVANNKLNYCNMFGSWAIMRKILCLMVILVVTNFQYSGTSYSFSLLGLGFRINTLIAGAFEFLGFLITNFVCQKLPRKPSLYGVMTVIILLLGCFQFLEIDKSNETIIKWVEGGLIGVLRGFLSFDYAMWALLLTESFNKEAYKGLAVGLVQSLAGTGALTPFLITFAQKINMKPLVLVALFSPIAIVFTYFLPETNPRPSKSESSAGEAVDQLQQQDLDNERYFPDKQLIN